MKKQIKKTVKKPVKSIKIPAITGGILASAVVGIVTLQSFREMTWRSKQFDPKVEFSDTSFGNFLALQHAIYSDDYEAAPKFASKLVDVDVPSVQTNLALSLFLAGKLNESAATLEKEHSITAQIAYAAWLVKKGDWSAVYEKFKGTDSQILAPFRIWSGVATGKVKETLKFIDSLPGHDSWKDLLRGQVYFETKDMDQARAHFAKVSPDFMNLNDYLYIMSFYVSGGFEEDAALLNLRFTSQPAGLYMLNNPDFTGFLVSDESVNTSSRRNLAFGLIQSVSHSPFLSATNISLLLLRTAEAALGEECHPVSERDALNYYIGTFFYSNGSERYKEYFNKIGSASPYMPFVLLKKAERLENWKQMRRELERAIAKKPLFIPSIIKLVNLNLQKGKESAALRIVNRALRHLDAAEAKLEPEAASHIMQGRAYLLSLRARIYRQSGNLNRAASDITHAGDILPSNPMILSEQAKVWALQNENIDEAYNFALALVKNFPADLDAWNTLAIVVRKNEGLDASLEILERVSRVAETNSYLFKNLGDAYLESGNKARALEAYIRAMELSDDGLVSESVLKRKIRFLSR
ncbi:MAG: hypothetical protein FWG80_04290 [Alphaproteobacteria bacterium]|nr:hypothetical protein [Alphaproteobacteria bacterium]